MRNMILLLSYKSNHCLHTYNASGSPLIRHRNIKKNPINNLYTTQNILAIYYLIYIEIFTLTQTYTLLKMCEGHAAKRLV